MRNIFILLFIVFFFNDGTHTSLYIFKIGTNSYNIISDEQGLFSYRVVSSQHRWSPSMLLFPWISFLFRLRNQFYPFYITCFLFFFKVFDCLFLFLFICVFYCLFWYLYTWCGLTQDYCGGGCLSGPCSANNTCKSFFFQFYIYLLI